MRTKMCPFQNMHTRNAHSKCVFNEKCVLKTNTYEEGEHQAKLVKIAKYQAKFKKIAHEPWIEVDMERNHF